MTCLERFKIRSLCASVVNSSSDHRVYFANRSVLRRIQKFQKEGSKAYGAQPIDRYYLLSKEL